jgi:glycosyltransferase involved in cell wall biosynthesis
VKSSRASPAAQSADVVLIAYHFPPDPAVGSLRAAKVARAFIDAGHSVDVVTARLAGETGMRSTGDPALRVHPIQSLPNLRDILKAIKGRLTQASTRHQETTATSGSWTPPTRIPIWQRFLFSLLWLPDDRQGFIIPAWRKARGLVRQGARIVYSTAPPFSPHLVGLGVRQTTRARWVMELRDPWADNTQKPWWVRTRPTDALDARIERYCLEHADLVVTVSDGIRARLLARLPHLEGARLITVRNGIERLVKSVAATWHTGPVRIAYVGTFYYSRDPRPFLRALAAVCRKHGWGPEQVRVDFAGACRSVGTVSVEHEIEVLRLTGIVQIQNWLPHAAAQSLIEDADVLLLLAQEQPDQVPNKLYEYLGARRTILAFADRGGETAAMLGRISGHHVITTEDAPEVERVLETLILAARRGERPGVDEVSETVLEEWTTEVQMKRLMTAVLGC